MKLVSKLFAVLLALSALPAIAGEPEVTYTPFPVASGETRYIRSVHQSVKRRVCVERDLELASKPCIEWKMVDQRELREVSLHASHADALANRVFEPLIFDNDKSYVGCGIAAAQKLLAYYGVYLSQDEIRSHIPTLQVPGQTLIAATPVAMEGGINSILNAYGVDLTVSRSWEDHVFSEGRITGSLEWGKPTIALVDDGGHYIVVFGKRAGTFDVHDNHWLDTREHIDTDFHSISGFWGGFFTTFSGLAGYVPGTLLNLY